jgi:amino acid permease
VCARAHLFVFLFSCVVLLLVVFPPQMGGIVVLLSLLPDLNHIWQLSAVGCLAAFMIIGYCIAGSSVAISEGFETDMGRPDDEPIHSTFKTFTAFGEILFGYGFHALLPDIQASLHDHDTKDAHKDTKKAVTASFAIAGPAYLIVGVLGYAAFGSSVESNLLLNVDDVLSTSALYVIWLFVAVKTAAEGAVFNQAAFTLIRDIIGLSIESDRVDHHPKNWIWDSILRIFYVGLATLVAIFVPFVS